MQGFIERMELDLDILVEGMDACYHVIMSRYKAIRQEDECWYQPQYHSRGSNAQKKPF